MTVQSLIDKIRILLHDVDAINWTDDELIGWLNDAQREISVYKPDVCVANETVSLEAGSKQSLPADGLTLIDAIRGMTSTGPARAVRLVPRRILDAQRPDWHKQTPVDEIIGVCFDDRDQKTFYVWPPSTGSADSQLEIVYAKTPPDVTIDSAGISIDDTYSTAIISYVAYRAYSKDSDYAADDSRAASHYSHFTSLIGGKEAGERNAEAKTYIRRGNRSMSSEGQQR